MVDIVTYELAVKLKEKGFNWICSHYYRTKCKDLFKIFPCEDWSDIKDRINAPTIAQVLKWLRKEKELHVEFISNASGYCYIISRTPKRGGSDLYCCFDGGTNDVGEWDDYEEAALHAIEYVLDNLM